jgi:hypothetical protein
MVPLVFLIICSPFIIAIGLIILALAVLTSVGIISVSIFVAFHVTSKLDKAFIHPSWTCHPGLRYALLCVIAVTCACVTAASSALVIYVATVKDLPPPFLYIRHYFYLVLNQILAFLLALPTVGQIIAACNDTITAVLY